MSSALLRGISSMATRSLLAELCADYTAATGQAVAVESVGGVDAAKRVLAGESFDLVVLAGDAMAKLMAAGQLQSGSLTPLVHSGVAVAVALGAALPDLSSEAAVRAAVLAAPSLSYSTGPSGVALAALFEHWGIATALQDRLVTPPPGVPVASLVASGTVALGFQQLSELIAAPGIVVAGPLPAPIQITTTFTAGIGASSAHRDAASALLAYLSSPAANAAKLRQGMTPA
jgi:molybdate transport system substrate-binding protein